MLDSFSIPPTPRLDSLAAPQLFELNRNLETMTARDRVAWFLEQLGSEMVLTTSFGAQAAVSLHLVTQLYPQIPVVFIDTGYLFPETYQFADHLTERLQLNLQVHRAALSPAWQEARWGKLWEQGVEGINQYNQVNKVEPMKQALASLKAKGWIAGLRRQQARTRLNLPVLAAQDGLWKMLPIIDWTDRNIFEYLSRNHLPYHPLWEKGYVSIGDKHTTRALADGISEEETRFFGFKRECGLHVAKS